MRISYLEHKTDNWVRSKINSLVAPQEPPLATAKRWKLARIGHVARHDSFSKTNHPAGHLGGWAMPWAAEEQLG